MSRFISTLRNKALHIWAVVIALVLWMQVHGQGESTLSMDVPLQITGLPQEMVVVNDLPDTVRVTVSGLQGRLNELKPQDIYVPLDTSGLDQPIVTERALSLGSVRLPSGITVEKVQPDRIQLQVDRVVTREVRVEPRFELPEEWKVAEYTVEPAAVRLSGPEVWLETLGEVDTAQTQPPLKEGPFEIKVKVESPSGKAIRLVEPNAQVVVRGVLQHLPAAQPAARPAAKAAH